MLETKDKELKLLKQSHLMQVAEFHKMVLALQRFKEDLAVKAITGRKNIRSQKTPDRIFFSVLEKMLLEVSSSAHDISFHKAEQQLLSLRKVFLWFESNKHVLMKSDGYFKSARKITEDIYEKQLRSRSKRGVKRAQSKTPTNLSQASLKTIDVHLDKLHKAEQDAENRHFRSDTSMFARSSTQDLTSIGSVTVVDRENFEEDLDFAREVYEHEYIGGNKIERLNRPMTAPLKLKPGAQGLRNRLDTPTEVSFQSFQSQEVVKARPQSALTQVQHDLSWAKTAPLPLKDLIHGDGEKKPKRESADVRRQSKAESSSDTAAKPTTHDKQPAKPTATIIDGKKIANLVMFKQFCVEHAAQQENSMRQYTKHRHGTRQHFLEFPENRTENIVRQTANVLYGDNGSSDKSGSQFAIAEKMGAYRGMSLEEFLDRDFSTKTDKQNLEEESEAETTQNNHTASTNASKSLSSKTPHPPISPQQRVIQPSQNPIKFSSVCELASGTGRRMNVATEQALSAPKHGWRYPMVPISSSAQPAVSRTSGVVLALQEEDLVQHRVLIPLVANSGEVRVQDQGVQTTFLDEESEYGEGHPKSPHVMARIKGSAMSSRPSTRPWSSPRYVTEVRAILRNRATGSRSCFDMRPDLDYGEHEARQRPLRSAGMSASPSRPRTAASWGSYPTKSEVSRSVGAASHHSTGVLRHRTVAETMRVKSVNKRLPHSVSGRSSASSYVAQLREKKRAGAKISAQSKPTAKRTLEQEQFASMEAEMAQKPHLSFIQLASPMQIPVDPAARTYARPGGVYCGSTAAIVVASEGQVNIMDENMSEGHLSYEEFCTNTPVQGLEDGDAKTAEDNWLSQWLSGGPLDGLHDSADIGKTTTYADLVSRAAIIDSSDERSYSEEVPSSTSAVGTTGVSPREDLSLSPKEDFSISPRTDPLVSHRTTTTDEEEIEFADSHEDEGALTQEKLDNVEEEASSNLSSEFGSSKTSGLSSGYSGDEEEEIDSTNTEREKDVHKDGAEFSTTENTSRIENPTYDFQEKLNSTDNLRNVGQSHTYENDKKSRLQEILEDDGSGEDSCSNAETDVLVNRDDSHHEQDLNEENDPPEQNPPELNPDSNGNEVDQDSGKECEDGYYEESEDDVPIDGSLASCSLSSYHSLTESEADVLSDSSPVRIVITSARKVERELLEKQSSLESNSTPQADPGERLDANCDQDPNDVENPVLDDNSRMITREEVNAVASLSRPQSGRPIPSESEVRDPFVDFVASTMQKQVDRSVDVQAIFKGNTPDDVVTKLDLDMEQKRETELEAAITMQRAYRQHLARTRAARKCQGLRKEDMEWARSYKTMLMQKKEMRKRRLREARQSSRSLQRREAKKMSRIGPHKDVYEIYHPGPQFPDPVVIQESAQEIQRMVRGWLVRGELKNVRQLAEKRENSLAAIVDEYRALLQRTQRRHGKLKPSLSLTYNELTDYLLQRSKYELAFKKRQFWNEMESSEMNAFFNDCGLFPSQDEVTEAVESVTKSLDFSSKKKKHSATALSREEVIEIAFHIYVPTGARMENQTTRASTWMTPICEGEEGLKLIGAAADESFEVENADFQIVSQFVARVYKERKETDE